MDSETSKEIILNGVAASPGVAHGPVFMLMRKELDIPMFDIPISRREEEIARFEHGLMETRRQISIIRNEVADKVGENEAAIFDAHLMVLEDRALIEETISLVIQTGKNAEYCFQSIANRFIEAFSKVPDEYIKERASDIRDVTRRLLNNLLGSSDLNLSHIQSPQVIVSDDLTPSETAHIDKNKVLAIVTDLGSRTSHSVIMARSIEVPAVVGLHNVSRLIKQGDSILVDGYDGLVIINPSEHSLYRYGKIRIERESIQRRFQTVRKLKSVTRDNVPFDIRINVGGEESQEVLENSGGLGVGLFRTESLFITRRDTDFPGEDEQFVAYKRMAEIMKPHPVIIRTLDLGGDKNPMGGTLGYAEANPFMGFRAIRFCLEHIPIFKLQLRAILRASAFGDVRMMYPMISSVSEIIRANQVLHECMDELDREGIAFNRKMKVGSMIEIPSAAYSADAIAEHCDFFSIGTNDLIQYMLAVDRVNDRIAHLYDPNHPAVLRTIRHIVDVAKAHKIEVGVCGEMAGDPNYLPLFLGLGIDEISVSGASISELKFVLRNITLFESQELARRVLDEHHSESIGRMLRDFYLTAISR
jgi:phosphotransferase system enzyme I (PtsI)